MKTIYENKTLFIIESNQQNWDATVFSKVKPQNLFLEMLTVFPLNFEERNKELGNIFVLLC